MPANETQVEENLGRAWVEFRLPPVMTEYFKRLHRRLRRSDVLRFERDPHVTVRWGIDPKIEPYRVQAALDGWTEAVIQFGPPKVFHNQTEDVLVVAVVSKDLQRMWRLLNLPNTVTTHPNYTPHITVAYLRKGKGKLYEGFDHGLDQRRRFILRNLNYWQPVTASKDKATYIGE